MSHNSQLTIRLATPDDIPAIARIVTATWHANLQPQSCAQHNNRQTADLNYALGVLDTIGCIGRATTVYIAEWNGNVAGCVALVDRRKPLIGQVLRSQSRSGWQCNNHTADSGESHMLQSMSLPTEHTTQLWVRQWVKRCVQESAQALAVCARMPQISYRGLLDLCQYWHHDAVILRNATSQGFSYQGEVALFILDSTVRGLGIGKQLWRYAMRWFAQRRIARIFLFTDTTCDWQYYEHIHMTQRASHKACMLYDGLVRQLM